MNLTLDDNHFFLYNAGTKKIERLKNFEGGLYGGDMSLDDTGTFAFYMGDYKTVHGVNMNTGETLVTHRLSYQSGNLLWARY